MVTRFQGSIHCRSDSLGFADSTLGCHVSRLRRSGSRGASDLRGKRPHLCRGSGYGILKDYLTPLRPVAKAEPAIRFETDPGR